jgi:hypothetical protein
LFHPPVLQFCRRKKRKYKKKNMTFLLVWNTGSYVGNFLVIFPIITPIGLSLLIFFILLCSLSYDSLTWFKISKFIGYLGSFVVHVNFRFFF